MNWTKALSFVFPFWLSTCLATYAETDSLPSIYKQVKEGQGAPLIDNLYLLVRKDPQNIAMRRYLAASLFSAGRSADAAEQFALIASSEQATEYDLQLLGDAYFYSSDYRKAAKSYQKLIDKNPNCFLAYEGLARCFISVGHDQTAKKIYTHAITRAADRRTQNYFKKKITEMNSVPTLAAANGAGS